MSFRFAAVLQTPKDEHSAVYIAYRALAGHLAAAGNALDILTPNDLNFQPRYGRLVPLVYPSAVRRWMLSHIHDYHVVIFHSYAGWRALGALERAGIPGVVAFHGLEPLYHRELSRGGKGIGPLSRRYRFLQERLMPFFLERSCRAASHVCCLNSEERDWLISSGWVKPERISVTPHGVPGDFFGAPKAPRALQTMLFVGQWLPMKGVSYLVLATTELMRADPALTLVCAGTLAGQETVLAAFDPSVRRRVRVIPRIDRESLARLYSEADVFVFPSLYEGFGRALAEAMASGVPIVTTRVGVAIDALRDGESALIVPHRDVASIVRAVKQLGVDPALRASIADGARSAAARYTQPDRTRELADTIIGLADRLARRYPYRNA
jgi:glycosyltransferase involved in cell wall biosynthesis